VGPKRRCKVDFFIHMGPFNRPIMFWQLCVCVFFFFFGLVNCMNLCGWVGIGFDNIMCYIHSRNKHS
jgi:hypothetical protein